MRVVGIDPASKLSGVALIDVPFVVGERPELIWTRTWERDDSKSSAENLHGYFLWLRQDALQEATEPEPIASMACVEFLSVNQNSRTTRVLSHYQAASVLACKELGMTVIEARVSSARKEALGRAGSKDEAWDAIRKLYPDHRFRRKTSGGTDEADAVVLALACRGLAER